MANDIFSSIADQRCYVQHCRITVRFDICQLATVIEHGAGEARFEIPDAALIQAADGTAYCVTEARAFIKRCHDFEDGTDEELDRLLARSYDPTEQVPG